MVDEWHVCGELAIRYNRNTGRKSQPSAIFYITNPTWNYLGSAPVLRVGRPTISRAIRGIIPTLFTQSRTSLSIMSFGTYVSEYFMSGSCHGIKQLLCALGCVAGMEYQRMGRKQTHVVDYCKSEVCSSSVMASWKGRIFCVVINDRCYNPVV